MKPGRPKQHTHNWSEWKMKTGNVSKWVERITEFSPGGFWIDRWWQRACIRGNKIKHMETYTPPRALELPSDLYGESPRTVFIQASGSPYITHGKDAY